MLPAAAIQRRAAQSAARHPVAIALRCAVAIPRLQHDAVYRLPFSHPIKHRRFGSRWRTLFYRVALCGLARNSLFCERLDALKTRCSA